VGKRRGIEVVRDDVAGKNYGAPDEVFCDAIFTFFSRLTPHLMPKYHA
jgi:hypothetical protein